MNLENFMQKTVQKKGILGLGSDDPRITKVNQHIVMAEEIFENRRSMEIQRPKIKDQVLTKLRNCLAGPAFLIGLRKNTKEIDEYLKKREK